MTIPNSILAQATVVNRSRPNRWTEITVTFDVDADVPVRKVEETIQSALAPLIGSVLVPDRKPNLRAAQIHERDIRYRVNVYATLGPNSEAPIRSRVVQTLQEAFAAAGIEFSSTSQTVLKVLAGATEGVRHPN